MFLSFVVCGGVVSFLKICVCGYVHVCFCPVLCVVGLCNIFNLCVWLRVFVFLSFVVCGGVGEVAQSVGLCKFFNLFVWL